MKNTFQLNIESRTSQVIPFEEIMFLCSLKGNLLSKILDEIYSIQIIFSDNSGDKYITSVVKVEAEKGEYNAYSGGAHWETALTKAFDSILYGSDAVIRYPA